MGIHPRGTVHRRDDAPPDDHAGQARRQTRRDADRNRCSRRLQYRRLWRPCQRDACRVARRPAHGLPLRQQEGGRIRRLHQHGPRRRLSRLWRLTDDIRDRMRDRRAGAAARDGSRSRSAARTWCAPATGSSRCGRTPPTLVSAATGSTNASTWSRRPWHREAATQSPRATTGRKAPASRWRCWNPARRPSIARAREMTLLPDGSYHLAVGSTEMGNGSVTSHRQIAASILGARAGQHRHHQRRHRSDTLRHRHLREHRHGRRRPGGGSYGQRLARQHPRLRQPPHRRGAADCRLDDGAVVCDKKRVALADLYVAGTQRRPPLRGQAQGLPVAAFGCVQCPGHPARGAPYDRRNPHPAQRARRRYRAADQSHAMPRPDRGRDRAWVSAGR